MSSSARNARAADVVQHLDRVLADTWRSLAATFGSSAVRTAKKAARIEAVLPGIYTLASRASEVGVRARALTLLAAPVGAITGLAAAHLLGIVDEQPERVTVQVPRHWHVGVPRWARLLRVPHAQQPSHVAGITVVAPADAVVQAWREARRDVAISTVIASIDRERCTASDLLEALARRKQMPRRGQLSELIGLVGHVVTSYLEYVAWLEVFPPRLFPELQWQVTIWANGRKRVMDAFDPEARIDLEFDGGGTHGGVAGFERDRARDADMRSEGIEPLHFTYRDLTQRPEWCRQVYLALRASRLVSGDSAQLRA